MEVKSDIRIKDTRATSILFLIPYSSCINDIPFEIWWVAIFNTRRVKIKKRLVISPTSKLEETMLCVEGKFFHIDCTSCFDKDWCGPKDVTGVMDNDTGFESVKVTYVQRNN